MIVVFICLLACAYISSLLKYAQIFATIYNCNSCVFLEITSHILFVCACVCFVSMCVFIYIWSCVGEKSRRRILRREEHILREVVRRENNVTHIGGRQKLGSTWAGKKTSWRRGWGEEQRAKGYWCVHMQMPCKPKLLLNTKITL